MTRTEGLIRVVGAVAESRGLVLVARRPGAGQHGHLWEFPGGKVEHGENDADALARELLEEFGVAGVVGALVGRVVAAPIELVCYRVRLIGPPIPLYHRQLRWVDRGSLPSLAMPPADQAMLGALVSNPRSPAHSWTPEISEE